MPPQAVLRPLVLSCLCALAGCTSENPSGLVVAVSIEAAHAPRIKRVDLRRVDAAGRVLKQRSEAGFAGRCARRDAHGHVLFAFEVGEESSSLAHIVSTAYADEAGREVLSEMRVLAPVGHRGYRLADLFLDFGCAAQSSACNDERCDLAAIACVRNLGSPDLHTIQSDWSRDDLCAAEPLTDAAWPREAGTMRDAEPDGEMRAPADAGTCDHASCPCAEAGPCPDSSAPHVSGQVCSPTDDTACRRDHVKNPYCQAGRCHGTCDHGWGNCDGDWALNGCETDLRTSDQHCGACSGPNVVCDYPGSCTGAECVTYRFGYLTGSGSTVLRWPANTFAGMSVLTGLDTRLVGVGLGTVVDTLHTPVRVRVGVYEEVNGMPGRLVAETTAFPSDALLQNHPDAVAGDIALEMRVSEPVPLLANKPYWIVMIADGDLYLRSEAGAWPWVHGTSALPFADLGHMPGSFQSVTTFTTSTKIPAAVLYGVAVPRR